MKRILLISVLVLLPSIAVSAQQRFVAFLSGAQEVPSNNSGGKGTCTIVLNAAQTQITVNCTFSGLGSNAAMAHIHANGAVGTNAPVLFNFAGVPSSTSGTIGPLNFTVGQADVMWMRQHLFYVNIHTTGISTGEIRGQIKPVQTVYDVDGDGRSDATVFRQSSNLFYSLSSLNGTMIATSLGTPTGETFMNHTWDFDGDGRGDPLLFKLTQLGQYTWTIYQTNSGTVRTQLWGQVPNWDDVPAPADYDGDGKQDVTTFRRGAFTSFHILQSSTGTANYIYFGTPGDLPAPGDYDGDGIADAAVVRNESGKWVWYIRTPDAQFLRYQFGLATDEFFQFAPSDFDGDGRQDIVVNRVQGKQRIFFILRSSDSQVEAIPYGLGTDKILFGDYDGDGKTDIVARRNTGGQFVWFIRQSSNGQEQYIYWGISGDQ